MRKLLYISLFLLAASVLVFSCSKYKDKAPTTDPRLTNPYCNDPEAVNYNVGFPGKPDNSVCIYAADQFKGTYIVKDSTVVESTGLLVGADSFLLYINPNNGSKSKINVAGFCSTGSLGFTSGRTLTATGDTTVGDTTTMHQGQLFCRTQDTVTGTISLDPIDNKLLHISLQIVNDTGILLLVGDGRKQ
jgi:hypothetical protein